MSDGERAIRTHVEIDGRGYLLGPSEDLVDLMGRIEQAARSGPAFVAFDASGQDVRVLISRSTAVVIIVDLQPGLALDPPDRHLGDWDF